MMTQRVSNRPHNRIATIDDHFGAAKSCHVYPVIGWLAARTAIVAVAMIFLATGTLPNRAEAAPWAAAMPQAQDGVNPIETVALCFYPNGWAGPGYYQCGYRLRYGEGFYERREREEREERRERRDYYEDRRERRDRYEDRRERRDRY
jgi:hypothetical protein